MLSVKHRVLKTETCTALCVFIAISNIRYQAVCEQWWRETVALATIVLVTVVLVTGCWLL